MAEKSLEEMQQEHPFPLWDVLKEIVRRRGTQAVSAKKQRIKRGKVRAWMAAHSAEVEEIGRRPKDDGKESTL